MKPDLILPQTVNFHNQALTTIDFHGQTLLATIQDDVVYTALKPICENISLSWNAQFERIKRDEVLAEGIRMIRIPTKGGFQDVVCLPLTLLNGWLFGVDVSRVKPQIKDKLITYKKECYQVLFDYWNNGVAVNPRAIKINDTQAYQIQKAVKVKCQHNSIHYQTIYHALYDEFGVPSYKDILASDFETAMAFIMGFDFAVTTSHTNLSNETLIRLSEQCFKTSVLIQQIKSEYLPFLENVNKNKGDKLNTCLTLLHYDIQDNCQDLFKLLASDIQNNKQHPITKNLEMAYYCDDLQYLLRVV